MDTADEQCGELASGQVDLSDIDFGEHARTIDPADVETLVGLVEDVRKIKVAIDHEVPVGDDERSWEELLAHLVNREIPDHMQLQLGTHVFTHEGAWTVSLELSPKVGVHRRMRTALFSWLEENGYDDLLAELRASFQNEQHRHRVESELLKQLVCKLVSAGKSIPSSILIRHLYVAKIKMDNARLPLR